jgi:glycerophosphoryl diester phosphodiesterase
MTKILAHRGSAGTHPENTFASYQAAMDAGADGIEIDVHLTKDGDLVVLHDATVNRTTNGTGYVKDFSLAEIKQLDAGSWFSNIFAGEHIPTLNEVLAFIAQTNLLLNIELKNVTIAYVGMEAEVIRLVKAYQLTDRVIVSSFNHMSLHMITQKYPDIDCAILTLDKQFAPWDYARTVGVSGIHAQWAKMDLATMKETQQRNYPVRMYTVNKTDVMEQLMKHQVDAIITDFPKQACAIRTRLGR